MENKMVCKGTAFSTYHRLNCRGRELIIDRPLVMGILNLTPDSFYDGGFYTEEPAILEQVERMIRQGADIIDVGAVSTRPGSTQISEREEERRLLPVLGMIRKQMQGIFLSVDTFRSRIAQQAVEAGADMINDIFGGRLDPEMIPTVARLGVPIIIMHMQGEPATMQLNPTYADVVREVRQFFDERQQFLISSGVQDIIFDPGFGFGKTVRHNYELLARLNELTAINRPLMVGLSRKSLINKVLETKPAGSLNGTTVLNTIALLKGAHILRVHDVKEAVEVVKLCRQFILNPGN